MRRTENATISHNYYGNNQERVSKCIAFLSDDLSKLVFKRIVLLRQTYEKQNIPPYDYFNQYFPKDIPEFRGGDEQEIFIDCGAFNGDTSIEFSRRFRNYKRIVAFEPDKRNICYLKKRKIRNLCIQEAACSDNNGEILFEESQATGGSHIIQNAESDGVTVKTVRIDDVPECQDASFIKMDIEGAEMDALKGAQETIKRNHPKLAICLYHSDADMIDIPEYIHNLVPEYSLYVRAHTMGIAETVLYAVDKSKQE